MQYEGVTEVRKQNLEFREAEAPGTRGPERQREGSYTERDGSRICIGGLVRHRLNSKIHMCSVKLLEAS